MGMGEIYGKLDGVWKTLGGNAAGLGKRECNRARLGKLLCRIQSNCDICESSKDCKALLRFARGCQELQELQEPDLVVLSHLKLLSSKSC